jgi:hypothetical protein
VKVKTLEAHTSSQLEACRVAAAQDLAAALVLERQQHEQQVAQQLREAHEAWSSKWEAAQSAAERQAALLGNAEYEVTMRLKLPPAACWLPQTAG